ncbi:MAG TPA: hypothetical protein PLL30_16895 [Candidatus Krumholzibacteria bacterium]|nr:hypothetical protein [Candidatus Krumholzibacteria bacterium]HPD73452.1 hypothetical protein [Candidatus Krumholzibacteria bacterium]HRY42174.1 hypothetical protein [Candidatus Krumholzibacteria bacterium]
MERISGRLHLGDGKIYYLVCCDEGEAEAFEAANAIATKPPTQRVEARGFEAFGEMKPGEASPVQLPPHLIAASKDPLFQRFIEDRFPAHAHKFTDSHICAKTLLAEFCFPRGADTPPEYSKTSWMSLLDKFQVWDTQRR